MKRPSILYIGLLPAVIMTLGLFTPPTVSAAGGDLLWTNQFDFAGDRDQALAVANRGSSLFVAGRVRNAAGNDDWEVNAYDAVTGDMLWTNRLDVAGGRDEALSVAVAGKVVAAAGRVRNGAANDDWFVAAYDTGTGAALWQDQFNLTNGNDRANCIAARGKTFVAAGRVRNIAGNDDWFVRAYDALTGDVLWQNQHDQAGDDDEAVAVTFLGNRAIAVGHVTNGAGDSDWFVGAYDLKSGQVLWTNQFDKVAGNDAALAVVGRSRSVFVGGYVVNGSGNQDFTVRAYDANSGNLLWEDEYDLATDDDRAVALAVKGSSLVAVGRVNNLAGDSDFAVRAYDAGSGAFLWQDRINPAGGSDSASAVTISGSTVLAVGRVTNNSGDTDWTVRAYNIKTGGLLWSNQYDQAAGDDEALAVMTVGKRAVVAGDAQNASGDLDWLVRTYAVK